MAGRICLNCFKTKGDFEVCPFCGWAEKTEPEQAYHLRPGTVLMGRYLIGAVLGFGGFGTTYKVWDNQLASIVAIKEFYPSGLVSRVPGEKRVVVFSGEKRDSYKAALLRFLAEARNMAKFAGHPNIVNVFNFFEENGTAYIVMEYLDGMSLRDYLNQQGGRLDIDITLDILKPVMSALSAVHAKGIIHRDIHPGNIYLTTDNQVKIIDFGAAKFATGDSEQTMTVIVTQGYASPEQYRSKSKQGPWIDVYGLGATFYKMVTGQLPEEAVDRQVEDHLPLPSGLGVRIDPRIERAIMKAMAVKTELRFSKIDHFQDAVFGNRAVDFPEVELRKKRKRVRIASVAIGLALALTVGFVVRNRAYFSEDPLANYSSDTISIWVPVSGAPEQRDLELAIFEDIKNKFEESVEGVSLEVIAVEEGLYQDSFEKAVAQGKGPTVFASNLVSPTKHAVSLDKLSSTFDKDAYLFLTDYSNWYPSKLEVPTGFDPILLFANTDVAYEDYYDIPEKVTALAEFLSNEAAQKYTVCFDPAHYGNYLALYAPDLFRDGDFKPSSDLCSAIGYLQQASVTMGIENTDDALDVLAAGNCTFLLGSANLYRSVQARLPGYYRIVPLENEGIMFGTFTGEWSVTKASTKNQQIIGMQLLRFLLSDYSQNLFYLQNDRGIPLNKSSFTAYIEVNREFGYLAESARNVTLAGQHQRVLTNFGRDINNDVVLMLLPIGAVERFLESYSPTDN